VIHDQHSAIERGSDFAQPLANRAHISVAATVRTSRGSRKGVNDDEPHGLPALRFTLSRSRDQLVRRLAVIEDMDRIFRDQADYHAARRRFEYHGVAIHTATGKIGKLDGSLRALMGEYFIDNLKVHVVRAMEGVVRDGRHAGGKAFGYQPVPGKPGELQIVEEQAAVIRRIFKEHLEGRTVQHRRASEQRQGRAPEWASLERLDDPRQRTTRQRHSAKRNLYWADCLEQSQHGEGQAAVAS
jgi:hypothetical protein